MPRNKKIRRIGYLSDIKHYAPITINEELLENDETITLTNEEFETIRLIDYKGYTQIECSKSMNIARTTIQQLYSDARYKISLLLLEGRHLYVEGGVVKLIDDKILEREIGYQGCEAYRLRGGKNRGNRNRQFRNRNK